MLNYIWLGLVMLSVIIGGYQCNLDKVIGGGFEAARKAVVDVAIPLSAIITIWLGIMRLAERAGLVQILARALRPAMKRLFPDVPEDHPAMGSIVMTIAANMLGLANAATPLGIRSMTELQKLSPYRYTATNAMCMFMTLNTASIQLIPATAVGILAVAGGKNPTAIVGTAFIATVVALTFGLLAVKFFEKLPIFRPEPETEGLNETVATAQQQTSSLDSVQQPGPLSSKGRILLCLYFLFFVYIFLSMAYPLVDTSIRIGINSILEKFGIQTSLGISPFVAKALTGSQFSKIVKAISVLAIPFFLSFFPLYGHLRGVKVYEQFVEGAKEGFGVAIRIMPFLVAILTAVGMFRTAGGIELLATVLGPVLKLLHFPVELLPIVFMRPLSGSGTIALVAETVKNYGPDHMYSMMAGTILGSTETTFYVLAVYFGAVGIRKIRHSVAAGLIADAVGVIASIIICRIMFS